MYHLRVHYVGIGNQTTSRNTTISSNDGNDNNASSSSEDGVAIEHNHELGFDTLLFQIISIHIGNDHQPAGDNDVIDDINDVLLIDEYGMVLSCYEDIDNYAMFAGRSMSPSSLIDIWCITNNYVKKKVSQGQIYSPCACTALLLKDQQLIQPYYQLIDLPFMICGYCAHHLFDSSLLITTAGASSASSGTNVSINSLTSFACQSEQALEFGVGLENAVNTRIVGAQRLNHNQTGNAASGISFDKVVFTRYLKKALYRAALDQQQSRLGSTMHNYQAIKQRLNSGINTVMVYEQPDQQAAALAAIDFNRVLQRVDEYISDVEASGQLLASDPRLHPDVAFVKGLLLWFKHDFFQWCNKPECSNAYCGARPMAMTHVGMAEASPIEANEGWASRVEVYQCGDCRQTTRFPRYNNPKHLMKTRRGRCGEWANAFCLVCRSVALDARYVLDVTDHVWVEIFIPALGGYVHADPCEKALDTPLMYEVGWNKKLSYVFSFSRHGVVDASSRYTRKWNEVISRRQDIPESELRTLIRDLDEQIWRRFQSNISTRSISDITADNSNSLLNSLRTTGPAGFVALSQALDKQIDIIERRRCQLLRTLDSMVMIEPAAAKVEEQQGRISGDQAWRAARGEIGTNGAGIAAPQAPKRKFAHAFVSAENYPSFLKQGLICGSLKPTNTGNYCFDVKVHSIGSGSNIDVVGGILKAEAKSVHGSGAVALRHYASICGVPVCVGGRGFHSISAAIEQSGTVILSSCSSSQSVREPDSRALYGIHAQFNIEHSTRGNCIVASGCLSDTGVVQNFDSASSAVTDGPLSANAFNVDLDTSVIQTVFNVDGRSHIFRSSDWVSAATMPITAHCKYFVEDCNDTPCVTAAVADTSSTLPTDAEYDIFPGFTCSHPRYILYPSDLVTAGDQARKICSENSQMLGYVSVDDQAAGASSGDTKKEICAFVFDATSMPPVEAISDPGQCQSNCVLHLKRAKRVRESSAVESCRHRVTQHMSILHLPLAGAQHGDSLPFDSTLFLGTVMDTISSPALASISGTSISGNNWWSHLRLAEVRIAAGPSLVNGVQCVYSTCDQLRGNSALYWPLSSFTSPLFTSPNDSPVIHSFKIEAADPVRLIRVRAGSLIDGIEFVTEGGRRFGAGGAGGSLHEFVIPSGWELIGFFGATGGHLHNLGVVLMHRELFLESRLECTPGPMSALNERIVRSCIELCLRSDAGMLNNIQNSSIHARHHDVGALIGATMTVILQNPSAQARLCFKACAAYAENIFKNPGNAQYRKVKVNNNYFIKSIAKAEGGVSLFQFGPCAFVLDKDSQCFEVRVSEAVIGGGGAGAIIRSNEALITMGQWMKWIDIYAKHCNAIVGWLSET